MIIKGNIHSLESFGTVDGPGIRFVTFMQGCPLRCLYCHNPDTWDPKVKGTYRLTPEGLLDEVLKYKNYIAKGGVTVTGGEPLMQAEFVKEFFQLCRKEGIHTALDTSGAIFNDKTKEVFQYTNLVLLDIKAISDTLHKEITGAPQTNMLRTLNYLHEQQIPMWIRYVIVPGYTDKEEDIEALRNLLKPYNTVEKIELLPYHMMGVHKYEQMGIEYPLKDTSPLTKEQLENLKNKAKESGLPV